MSFHNLTIDNGYIKVFSVKSEDIRVLNEREEKKSGTKSDTEESQVLQSPSLMREQEDINQPESSKIEKSETESLAESGVNESQTDQPEEIREEDMLEEVKLYGTLLKTIKLPRNLDY